MDEDRRRQRIREAFDQWAAGTGSPFDLLAADATWTVVGNSVVAGAYQGRDDFFRRALQPYNARLSTPAVPTVHGIYADGDVVIAYFDSASTARDGLPYRNTYTWYLTMPDQEIVDVVAFFDSIAFDDLWHRVTPA